MKYHKCFKNTTDLPKKKLKIIFWPQILKEHEKKTTSNEIWKKNWFVILIDPRDDRDDDNDNNRNNDQIDEDDADTDDDGADEVHETFENDCDDEWWMPWWQWWRWPWLWW